MSSVEYLREFVSERLTAAAEEIFRVFKKTIVEYEEELDRQRRLLDVVWKPEIKLNRIEQTQQHIFTEKEVADDEQLSNQERKASLDQENPDPSQIKEEQEELCASQEGEQLVLKQENDIFMLIPPYEESDHCEHQTVYFNDDLTQSEAGKEPVVKISVKSCVVPAARADHQLLCHDSCVAESQDRKESEHEDLGSIRNARPDLKRRRRSKNVCNVHWNSNGERKRFECDTCGKDFKAKSKLDRHLLVHTGERPYFCKNCGKSYSDISTLKRHEIIHTGLRPFPCPTCGKNFKLKSHLKAHLLTHSDEKQHHCNTCGIKFTRLRDLKTHLRIHPGQKQCTCTA